MDRLEQAVNRLGRSITARASHSKIAEDVATQQANLPLKSRKALLFEPGNRLHRPYLQAQVVYLPSRQQAVYSGPQLGSDDKAVWLQLLHWWQVTGQDQLEFSSLSFLKTLGWGQTRHDMQHLRICLERLQASCLRIKKGPDMAIAYSLLQRCEWRRSPSGQSGRWKIVLEAELVPHFTSVITAQSQAA